MLGTLPVKLDGKTRALDAESREKLRLRFEGLPGGNRLLHPSEDDPLVIALERNLDQAGSRLKPDRGDAQRSADDERRAEDGMSGERQLARRREDPHGHIAARLRRQQEDRLREVHLAGELEHLLRAERAPVEEDTQLVALERLAREHIDDQILVARER